jgi:predicted GNAT family N-acyltransferase
MNVRLLNNNDIKKLEQYLLPNQAESMYMCSNMKSAGLEYNGNDFEGHYFGFFTKSADNQEENIVGVLAHYWNNNVMIHTSNLDILDSIIEYFKKHIKNPIASFQGPNAQVEYIIKALNLEQASFDLNKNLDLFAANIQTLNEINIPSNLEIVSSADIDINLLKQWMRSYDAESLGATSTNIAIDEQKELEKINQRLRNNNSWTLLLDGVPVSLSAFNARTDDMVQVGPVWTPKEYRNKGFARILLYYTLKLEKIKGTKQAILFTGGAAAIKAYIAIGFKKIGDYNLAILEHPQYL